MAKDWAEPKQQTSRRGKANLLSWPRDESLEDTENLPPPEVLAARALKLSGNAEEIDLLDTMLSGLVELLEEKGIITEEEYEKRVKSKVNV